MKVITHSGTFHADEVFAIALLKLIFKNKIEIIRTRDDNINADLYIDVGGKFDNIQYFDHHFKEFDQYHDVEKKLPKSSFGLIWDKYAPQLIDNKNIINKVRIMFVIPIDAHDNNVRLCKYNETNYNSYTLSNVISSFNKKSEDENDQFLKALEFAEISLQNAIDYIKEQFDDEQIVKNIFDQQSNTNKSYIVLDKHYNYSNAIKDKKYSYITHLIFPEDNKWRAVCIKDNITQKLKAPFPMEWGGLFGNELESVSNIPGSVFCHRGLWIAVNHTQEGVIEMVEKCFR